MIPDFSKLSVLVYGDVMIDEYVDCTAHRLSQEAPVPVVIPTYPSRLYAGGAGNVANNAAALGAQVTLVGIAGGKNPADIKTLDLILARIAYPSLVIDENRPQTRKTRYVVRGQQIMRVDHEATYEPLDWIERELDQKLTQIMDADVVIVSDYAKGAISTWLMQQCSRRVRNARFDGKKASLKPLWFVAPKRPLKLFEGADWLVMNGQEFVSLGDAPLDCHLLVTHGPSGMMLHQGSRRTRIEARRREVYDVSGAGDTVLAAFACSIAAGCTPDQAAHLANCAAGVAVSHRGTYAVTRSDLEKEVLA